MNNEQKVVSVFVRCFRFIPSISTSNAKRGAEGSILLYGCNLEVLMHNRVCSKRLAIGEGGLKIVFKVLAWIMSYNLFSVLILLPPSWMLYYWA